MRAPQIDSTPISTRYGDFDLYCFSWSEHEEDNILTLKGRDLVGSPLVRIQSACYTGEIFASTDCDCHAQLEESLTKIGANGGLFIYMLRDGRGAGLRTKVKALRLMHDAGLDTADAYDALQVPRDPRTYEQASYVLEFFALREIRLLTNNPRKVAALEESGISVSRISLEIPATRGSAPYLRTKAYKMGHYLRQFGSMRDK